ncbi:hypothetical protein [Nocardioides sp. SYSU DS0663]|uniref:hypothetical protein n=1 Tax=Nocardioides sp. SYSU DS0663 TaxID=3416445 RepID=UPI003F4C23AE
MTEVDATLRAALAAACAGDAPAQLREVAEAVAAGRTTWQEVWERPGPLLVGRVLADLARRWAPPA